MPISWAVWLAWQLEEAGYTTLSMCGHASWGQFCVCHAAADSPGGAYVPCAVTRLSVGALSQPEWAAASGT